MSKTLSQALDTPAQPSELRLSLECAECHEKTECVIRGVAATSELEPLGELKCAHCGHHDLDFLGLDRFEIQAKLLQLLSKNKRLPHNRDGFFRGGDYQAFGRTYQSARQLRTLAERQVIIESENPAALLSSGAAMLELRAYSRALELAKEASKFAPQSPEPYVMMSIAQHRMSNVEEAQKMATEAFARRQGVLLTVSDRAKLFSALIPFSKESTSGPKGKPGPNDSCPCGSGKKFKKCCGAVA